MVKSKRAIAMIELIFALVIMGIVLMSAPMLIQQSIKSSNIALQQEAIVAAASQTAIVLSMHWDENNTITGDSKILDKNLTSSKFTPKGLMNGASQIESLRNFDINDSKHPTISSNFGRDETNNTETNESDYTKFDDVDDYHNSDFGLILFNGENTTSDVGEYIDTNISIRTKINYAEEDTISLSNSNINITNNINNNTNLPLSNIKFITVNLTSNSGVDELEKNITFKAFSSNIGTYDIYGRIK